MKFPTNENNVCPNCNCKLNAATALDSDSPPEPGDYSYCIECGTCLEFGLGLIVFVPKNYKSIPKAVRKKGKLIQRKIMNRKKRKF